MSVTLSKGILYLAEMNPATGLPKTGFFDLGECDGFSLQIESQRQQKFSNRNCASALIADIRTRITTNARIQFAENTANNIKAFLQGAAVSVAGTAITNETLMGQDGTTLPAVGEFLFTKHPIASGLVVKDSAGSPVTLVLNTDYKLIDGPGGVIQIIASLTGKTAPIKADYTPTAHSSNKLLTAGEKDYCVRYSGVNCVTNQHENWEIYQVRLAPPSEWQVLGAEEFASYESTSPVLFNTLRDSDALYGGYARQLTL